MNLGKLLSSQLPGVLVAEGVEEIRHRRPAAVTFGDPACRLATNGTSSIAAARPVVAELRALREQRVQPVDLDELLGEAERRAVPVDVVADQAAELGVADVELGDRLAVLRPCGTCR